MKSTNFALFMSSFISNYLPDVKGSSINTIKSYRDTYILLIKFIEKTEGIKIERLTLEMIKKKTITNFLDWIELKKNCSVSTRNQRLAAIHSFYRYIQYESIDNLYTSQEILSIPFKKSKSDTISFLTTEGMKVLLKQPDTSTKKGYRELAILSLMYETGCRVQELIDLTPSSLNFNTPSTIKVIGKGNKARLIPLIPAQTEIIKKYIHKFNLHSPSQQLHPLFFNSRKDKLTRAGVGYILQKNAKKARDENALLIPNKISCHSLRHSKAMHLLQGGTNLVFIRDILGHASIKTTELYARVDSKFKREAIEKAYTNINPNEDASWESNSNLLAWLKKF